MKQPTVFIVVLNYNNSSATIACIKSLENINYLNYKIVIVDNDSKDASVEEIQKQFPNYIILNSNFNKGYAGGMNIGIKYSIENNADFILLSNNDMVYPKSFLTPLIEAFKNDSKIGIISPKVLYLDNKEKIYCAGGEIKTFRCGGISKFRNKLAKEYGNKTREISLAEGASLLVKRDVFTEIGLLSEKYFMYFEDVEFSERVSKKFTIKYIPESVVFHKSGAGQTWSEFSPLYYFYFTRNRLLYYSSKNIFVRIYVICFSLLNVCAKTVIMLLNIFKKSNQRKNVIISISNLYKGFIEGLMYTLKLKKNKSDLPILK